MFSVLDQNEEMPISQLVMGECAILIQEVTDCTNHTAAFVRVSRQTSQIEDKPQKEISVMESLHSTVTNTEIFSLKQHPNL